MKSEIINIATYFPHLDDFEHKSILADLAYPWDVLKRIGQYTLSYIEGKSSTVEYRTLKGARILTREMRLNETILTVDELIEIRQPTIVEGAEIFLDEGVVLEPGAMIKAPAVIGADTEVRHGAYIRGNALIGQNCTIGHATEIKNAIFMNHTEAGHFAYVGDSVLGSYVNLGAGTKLANLQLRKAADKLNEHFPPIHIRLNDEKINTGTAKFGAIIGDHCEAGCNSVTAPAVLLGAHSWILANTTVMKGFYPPRTVIRK
jgi:NDP-sugar pyrophosphorylase family protein